MHKNKLEINTVMAGKAQPSTPWDSEKEFPLTAKGRAMRRAALKAQASRVVSKRKARA